LSGRAQLGLGRTLAVLLRLDQAGWRGQPARRSAWAKWAGIMITISIAAVASIAAAAISEIVISFSSAMALTTSMTIRPTRTSVTNSAGL